MTPTRPHLPTLLLALVLALAFAPAAGAQQTPPRPGPAPHADAAEAGRLDGRLLAGEAETFGYALSGFAGGLPVGLLGPLAVVDGDRLPVAATAGGVGWLAATVARASRPAAVPPEVERSLAERGPEYGRAFREAYAERLRGRRRSAAALGGVAGTVAGAALLLRVAARALE
jgi:hypothetical protein